ncbi:MAG: amino acid permease [bacterium]|nr:amino acid permease [bacterium]
MKKKNISIGDIVFINIAALIGVRWFSTAGKYGAGAILLWILAAFLFFIPVALICAEFASLFPDEKGGMMSWIKQVFGEKTSFFASWLYYVSWYFYYPAILTFTSIAFAYALYPKIASSKVYVTIFVIVIYWAITFIALHGDKATSKFAKLGGLFGNIIPIFAILALGAASVFILDVPIPTDYSLPNWIPSFNNSNLMFLSTLALAIAGVELSSPFATSMKNPIRDYPKAIIISGFCVCFAYILGTVALTFVLAPADIGAASGILVDIIHVTKEMKIAFVGKILCLLIFLAPFAGCTVILLATTRFFVDGNDQKSLPKIFISRNKNDVPHKAVIMQGVIITIIILSTNLLSTIELIYAALVLTGTILLFIPYLILVLAYFKIKFKEREKYKHAPFKMPFGNTGAIIAGCIVIFTTLVTILVPIFSPPPGESTLRYELILVGCPVIFIIIGFLMHGYVRKKRINK